MFFPVLKSRLNPLKGFAAIPVFFACFLVIWAADKFVIRRLGQKSAIFSIIALVSANAALQVLCLNYLRVKPSWDFGALMAAADDISLGRRIRNWGYFQEYPYNINPAVIIGTFKYLSGGNQSAPYVLNILSVTVSIIGACLLAYKAYGRRAAVLTSLFLLGITPMYLYIPIVYTDTLSMPFAIWAVYAWSLIKPGKKRLPFYCMWIGLLSAAGFLVKQIAALSLAAFAVDFILDRKRYFTDINQNKSFPKKIISVAHPPAVAFLTFLIAVSAFHFYVGCKGYDSRLDYSRSLPFTHWLMMGMNTIYKEGGTSSGYGGFSAEDLKYSRAYQTSADKQTAEIEIIKKRLRQYGITGYAKFLLKKFEWTWTDGTYYAPEKLGRFPIKRTILHKFVLYSNGKANRLYLIFAQFVQAVLLTMILTGCIISLKKGPDRIFRFMTLMSLGLMFFLLFWETRSRYLVFMLPVFAVMAVYGMMWYFKGLDRAFTYLGSRL